jgi:hypothetical protein
MAGAETGVAEMEAAGTAEGSAGAARAGVAREEGARVAGARGEATGAVRVAAKEEAMGGEGGVEAAGRGGAGLEVATAEGAGWEEEREVGGEAEERVVEERVERRASVETGSAMEALADSAAGRG